MVDVYNVKLFNFLEEQFYLYIYFAFLFFFLAIMFVLFMLMRACTWISVFFIQWCGFPIYDFCCVCVCLFLSFFFVKKLFLECVRCSI